MKAFRIFSMLLTMVAFLSCDGSKELPIPNTENTKTYEIKMNLGGEYVETSESPLSRTETPKKYYGVNVYCKKDDGTTNSYYHYAYGIFDNIEDMKITLLGGYKYKFECTSIQDGEDKIEINETHNGPFSSYSTEINKFTISSYNYLDDIQVGGISVETYGYFSYPRTNRYYGELEDYIPTDNDKATISMKRTVFGINMKVNAIPDGELFWYLDRELFLKNHSHTGNDTIEFSSIYTFYDVYQSWKNDNYTINFTLYFTWERSNGFKQSFSKTISVKRNVMTNVNVTLEGGSGEVSLGINEENSNMTNETIEIDFDGGSLSDTNVNPEE